MVSAAYDISSRPLSTASAANDLSRGRVSVKGLPAHSELPFVGREPELEVLAAALREAREGRGCLVLLVGEAGIGKTRALEEFGRRADASARSILWGRCAEQEG